MFLLWGRPSRFGFNMSKNNLMIDRNALKQFDDLQMDGEPDILIEVIDSYFSTSPILVDGIITGISKKDALGAAKNAHSLKYSSQMLGAVCLGELCEKIEKLKESESFDELIILSEKLKTTYEQSLKELVEIRSTLNEK